MSRECIGYVTKIDGCIIQIRTSFPDKFGLGQRYDFAPNRCGDELRQTYGPIHLIIVDKAHSGGDGFITITADRPWSSVHHTIAVRDCVFSNVQPEKAKPEPMHDGKDDVGKLRYSLIPHLAERERAAVMTFGAKKYGARSWRTVPNAQERYLDAALRHIAAYRAGELLDPESGLPHLAHASISLDFMLELQMTEAKK